MSLTLSPKTALLLSIALLPCPAYAQDADDGGDRGDIVVTGTRVSDRTATTSPVPIAARSAICRLRDGANILVFRTLAKAYGLAGLSIGYAIAPVPLAKGLRDAGIGAPHGLSRLNLVAASAAIADPAHISRVRAWTLARRNRLEQALDALLLQRTESHANFVYFARPPPMRSAPRPCGAISASDALSPRSATGRESLSEPRRRPLRQSG